METSGQGGEKRPFLPFPAQVVAHVPASPVATAPVALPPSHIRREVPLSYIVIAPSLLLEMCPVKESMKSANSVYVTRPLAAVSI